MGLRCSQPVVAAARDEFRFDGCAHRFGVALIRVPNYTVYQLLADLIV